MVTRKPSLTSHEKMTGHRAGHFLGAECYPAFRSIFICLMPSSTYWRLSRPAECARLAAHPAVYRFCNARMYQVASSMVLVGLALV